MKRRLPTGYTYRADRQSFQCRFRFKRKSYYVYGVSIEECEQKKAEKLEQLKSGIIIEGKGTILNNYYRMWLDEQKKMVKPSSIYTTEKYWAYISDTIGQKTLGEIQKTDIIEMQNALLEKHSADTVNRAHKLLTQVLSDAVKDRLIDFNPAKTVKRIKSKKLPARDTNHRALTVIQQKQFFRYAKGSLYFNLFVFLINTGMRVGEALALTWRDVDFKQQVIRISKTVMRVGGSEYEISETPKTSSSNRAIPLTQTLMQTLSAQKAQNAKYGHVPINGLIFTNNKGEMSNYNAVNSAITRILNTMRADGVFVDHFSVHAFRATFATRCIEQGMPPIVLKEILGHSSLKMTMDVYAHVLPDTLSEELNKIEVSII